MTNKKDKNAICTKKEANSDICKKKEAAEYLTFSVRTLERLIVRKEIPYYRFGRAVRFLKTDLDKWIKDHKV